MDTVARSHSTFRMLVLLALTGLTLLTIGPALLPSAVALVNWRPLADS